MDPISWTGIYTSVKDVFKILRANKLATSLNLFTLFSFIFVLYNFVQSKTITTASTIAVILGFLYGFYRTIRIIKRKTNRRKMMMENGITCLICSFIYTFLLIVIKPNIASMADWLAWIRKLIIISA